MPAALVSLLVMALAIGVLPLPWPLQGAALVGLLVLAVLLARRWGLVLLLVLPILFGWGLLAQPHAGPADPVRLIPAGAASAPVELRGQLLSDPTPDPSGASCRVVLQSRVGRTELRFQPCPRLQQGWRLQVSGALGRPRAAAHPLLSGSAERLARQGVWSQLRVQQWQVLERPATPMADLRRRMAAALLAVGGADAGGVLAALVLGSAVVPVPMEVRDAFRVAGLSHALAASGFHLTVLLGAVMALGRHTPKPVRWLLALGAMLLFLLLAGPQPSVVRAVLMGAVAFVVQESGRRARPLGVLLLCLLLILLVAPAWLLDVGFQLSVAATAGLMLTARPLEQALARWPWPTWAAAGIAVPLAASLWTLPLQLLHFGALPLYAVPANLVVAPLLSPLTLGAMAMAVAAVTVTPLVALLGWALVPLTRMFLWLAALFAGLPMAQWQLGKVQPLLVLVFGLGLLPWLLPEQGRGHRWRSWGMAAMAAVMAVHLGLLHGDQLLLVHEAPRDWLVARHGGRAALITSAADGLSCSRARQLAVGLGIQRYDWALVLDPVAAEGPSCWQALTPTLVEGLQLGQRLASPGLQVEPLAEDSQALVLQAGRLQWGLLPDRQAWWSWQRQPRRGVDGLWLGFTPGRHERQALPALPANRLWLPAAGSPSGWRQA
jgi:competence protein ComEC